MPIPRTPTTDPAALAARSYRDRKRAGLVVVPVTVPAARRSEIEAIAAAMCEERLDAPRDP